MLPRRCEKPGQRRSLAITCDNISCHYGLTPDWAMRSQSATTLQIADGPADPTAAVYVPATGQTGVVTQQFRLAASTGTATVTQVVVTKAGTAVVSASGAHLYVDTNNNGVLDGDTQIGGTGISFSGNTATFTVTASGTPTPALTVTGALPAGVTFVDNGNGTATLAGTPMAGSAGTYDLTIKAANSCFEATQPFTLTVKGARTATRVTSTPNPSSVGQPVRLGGDVAVNEAVQQPALFEHAAILVRDVVLDPDEGPPRLDGGPVERPPFHRVCLWGRIVLERAWVDDPLQVGGGHLQEVLQRRQLIGAHAPAGTPACEPAHLEVAGQETEEIGGAGCAHGWLPRRVAQDGVVDVQVGDGSIRCHGAAPENPVMIGQGPRRWQ